MKFLTWQNPEQLFVAQVLINKVKSKCCGIKGNFNIEAFCTYLIRTTIYGYAINHYEENEAEGLMLGGKLGYAIKLNKRLRITPQIGGGHLLMPLGIRDSYADFAMAGIRSELMLLRSFGISLTPEFAFPIVKGKLYEQISEISSKVKGWTSGFNARFGLFFNF